MTAGEIVDFVESELVGTVVVVASQENGAPEMALGDVFFIYDPEGEIPPEKQFPYAAIVKTDYPGFDELSELRREGVFRVNVWVNRATFDRVTASIDLGAVDYTVLDEVIPHPVYGRQSWLSVLNPGESTSIETRDLLRQAHELARVRYEKKAG